MSHLTKMSELTYYRGRVALAEILKALGIGHGDEVALQAFTCLAMPEGILATGAKPCWIDIEHGGVNMDPKSLEERLSDGVKAVVVQHTFGIPAQLDLLVEICERRGIPLIEDCCHTYASRFAGRLVGEFGVGAFYSFEWGKPLVAGIGGSAVLNDDALDQKVKSAYTGFVSPGKKSEAKIGVQYAGYSVLYSPKRFWMVRDIFQKLSSSGAVEGNYNPSGEIAADFGLRMASSCRKRLEKQIAKATIIEERARGIAEFYKASLVGSPVLKPVFVPELADPVYARFPLISAFKKEILDQARAHNIEIAEWYSTAVHPLGSADWKAIGLEPGSCPHAEQRASEIISLPINAKTNRFVTHRTVGFLSALVE